MAENLNHSESKRFMYKNYNIEGRPRFQTCRYSCKFIFVDCASWYIRI